MADKEVKKQADYYSRHLATKDKEAKKQVGSYLRRLAHALIDA
ncbi:MAG: hypothetical protein ACK40U_09430 [Fervidobacterium pennivorans]